MALKSDIKALIEASFAQPDPALRAAAIDAYAASLALAIATYVATCTDAESRPITPGPTE